MHCSVNVGPLHEALSRRQAACMLHLMLEIMQQAR